MTTPGTWFKELRLEFLTASVIPVLLAAAIARYEKALFDPYLFVMTLLGAVCLHLGTNVANDYFDHISGNDRANINYVRPFTGGSRLIQDGLIKPKEVLTTSILFFAAAAVIAAFLTAARGPAVIVFGLAGLFSGYFYCAPPLYLAYRGFGEFVVGLNFGILIVLGTYYVQTGTIAVGPLIAAMPLALLITSVIVINEFQDSEADAQVGKRTLVVRLGTRRAVVMFALITLSSYIPLLAGAASGLLPRPALLGLFTLPLAVRAIMTAKRHHASSRELSPANASTILCHALTGLLMFAGYIISA